MLESRRRERLRKVMVERSTSLIAGKGNIGCDRPEISKTSNREYDNATTSPSFDGDFCFRKALQECATSVWTLRNLKDDGTKAGY